jgi:undecaprenyl-diphosphatase
MLDIDRWAGDVSAPSRRDAWRDLGVRVALPAAVWWAVVVGLGLLLGGPMSWVDEREDAVSVWLAGRRTATLDTLTKIWGEIGNTETVIAVAVVVCALVWWRTRRWWYAVVPALTVAVQSAVFLPAATVVGRERPDVEKLDAAPPTSSFPSGHTGAATALYVSLALLCQQIRHTGLRLTLTVVLLAQPLLVGSARLYRGMHHPSDVVVGILNGLVCVVLGWNWLRRSPADADEPVTADAAEARR